jgi:Replication protein C N-terminal domain
MQTHIPTTPFGRRLLRLAHVATQMAASSRPPDKVAHKWWAFRSICTARPKLGVSERALAVLNALLSFYPDTALTREVDLVFPSSEQLGLRAHGMCAPTSLRAPAALVGSGLIIRRDSPKRLALRAEGEGRRDQATQAVQQHAPTDRVGAGHARGPAAQSAPRRHAPGSATAPRSARAYARLANDHQRGPSAHAPENRSASERHYARVGRPALATHRLGGCNLPDRPEPQARRQGSRGERTRFAPDQQVGGTVRHKFFRDPVLVRAMRRLQSRSPKRTGGR